MKYLESEDSYEFSDTVIPNAPTSPEWRGTDINVETSLFEYGFVIRQDETCDYPDEWTVLYKINENIYDYGHIRESELNDIINGRDWASNEEIQSMLNMAGITKKEWLELSVVYKLSDVIGYWGTENIMGSSYGGVSKEEAEKAISNDEELEESAMKYLNERITYKVGDVYKISDGSGLQSNKIVTIVDRSKIQTDRRSIPTNVSGAYKPVDWSREVAYVDEKGEYGTMFKDRLFPVNYEKPIDKASTFPDFLKDNIMNTKRQIKEMDDLNQPKDNFEEEDFLADSEDNIENQPDYLEDGFIIPSGHLGSKVSASLEQQFIGEFNTEEEAIAAIKAEAGDEYFPNIWKMDDHGGTIRVTESTKKIKEGNFLGDSLDNIEYEPDYFDDGFIYYSGKLGSKYSAHLSQKFLGEFNTKEEALAAIKIESGDDLYPNIWYIDNHEKVTPITESTKKIKEADMVMTYQKVKQAIQGYKTQLIRKAKIKGIWENFGQKEVRDLQDRFHYPTYEEKIDSLISAFSDWIENYEGKEESVNKIKEAEGDPEDPASELRIEEIKFNSPTSGYASIRYPEFDKAENIVFIIQDGSVQLNKQLTNEEDSGMLMDAIYAKFAKENRVLEGKKFVSHIMERRMRVGNMILEKGDRVFIEQEVVDDKTEIISQFTKTPAKDIKKEGNVLTAGSEKFLVLTESEADEACKKKIDKLIEDTGIQVLPNWKKFVEGERLSQDLMIFFKEDVRQNPVDFLEYFNLEELKLRIFENIDKYKKFIPIKEEDYSDTNTYVNDARDYIERKDNKEVASLYLKAGEVGDKEIKEAMDNYFTAVSPVEYASKVMDKETLSNYLNKDEMVKNFITEEENRGQILSSKDGKELKQEINNSTYYIYRME